MAIVLHVKQLLIQMSETNLEILWFGALSVVLKLLKMRDVTILLALSVNTSFAIFVKMHGHVSCVLLLFKIKF
jgi:hypothetical protein